MKIKITTDSTCDLGEYIEKRNFAVMPLNVILGDKTYYDGVDITPADIFAYVAKTNVLPKTAAPSIGDYEEFFRPFVEEGYDVLHFDISEKSSSAHVYAREAAKSFGGKVTVIDSMALSSGQGLMVMKAADLAEEGLSAGEIASRVKALAPKINTSFIPDRLDYLYKGGRCSRMSMYGANLLKIHPLIAMSGGQLIVKKKYKGNMDKCIKNYIADLREEYPAYDKTRCFVTHSSADKELVEFAINEVKKAFSFDEVIETVAGSVITGHCGRNTLGVLFIAE